MKQILFPVAAILMTTAAISAAHRQSVQAGQTKAKVKQKSTGAIPLRKL